MLLSVWNEHLEPAFVEFMITRRYIYLIENVYSSFNIEFMFYYDTS